MFTSGDEILRFIEAESVEFVDVRFCDLPGTVQHFTVPGRSQNLTSTNCTPSVSMNRSTSSPLVNIHSPLRHLRHLQAGARVRGAAGTLGGRDFRPVSPVFRPCYGARRQPGPNTASTIRPGWPASGRMISMGRADRLRWILDLVEESLDQPGLTGDDLAARAFLSRFHFDRLAAAALGEPPGAFRRRLPKWKRDRYARAARSCPVSSG